MNLLNLDVPPLLEEREDLEEVDHCLVSSPLACRVSPNPLDWFSASMEPLVSLASSSFSGLVTMPLFSPPSSLQLYWAIFFARASCVSSSKCRMSSMVRPYHSSCQHQACRWARTITFLNPDGETLPCSFSQYHLMEIVLILVTSHMIHQNTKNIWFGFGNCKHSGQRLNFVNR